MKNTMKSNKEDAARTIATYRAGLIGMDTVNAAMLAAIRCSKPADIPAIVKLYAV